MAISAVLNARSAARHATVPVNNTVDDEELIKIFIDTRNDVVTKHSKPNASSEEVGIIQGKAFNKAFHAVVDVLVPKPAPAAEKPKGKPSKLDLAINLNFW